LVSAVEENVIPMIVTLDVYSGLPNPSWTLSAKDVRKLVRRLGGKAMAAPYAVESKLGYRGFLIAASSDTEATKAGLPDIFRIGGVPEELATPAGLALPVLGADEADDTAIWLLTTAGPAVPDGLVETVKEMISSRDSAADTGKRNPARRTADKQAKESALTAAVAAAAGGCVIQNTPNNPAFWNTPAAQPRNNCQAFSGIGRSSGRLPISVVKRCPNCPHFPPVLFWFPGAEPVRKTNYASNLGHLQRQAQPVLDDAPRG